MKRDFEDDKCHSRPLFQTTIWLDHLRLEIQSQVRQLPGCHGDISLHLKDVISSFKHSYLFTLLGIWEQSCLSSSCVCWMRVHSALIILCFPAGADSKHVDLKLKKLVDVSPRRVASPSSPSSSSSSPTASSASPVSPTEGQEVHAHSGHSYFPRLFPSLASSFLLSLSLSILWEPPVFPRHHQRVIGSVGSDCPWFSGGDLVLASVS